MDSFVVQCISSNEYPLSNIFKHPLHFNLNMLLFFKNHHKKLLNKGHALLNCKAKQSYYRDYVY